MQIPEQVKVIVQKVQLCQCSLHRWHRKRPERISLRHISDRSSETAETDLPLDLLTGQNLPFPQGQLLRSSLILRPLSLLLTLTRSAGPQYGLHLDVLLHPPPHPSSLLLLLLLLLLLRLKINPLILDRRNRYSAPCRPISHPGSLCEGLKVPSGEHVRVDGGHVDITIIPVRRVSGDGLSMMRVLFWVQRTVGDWRRGHRVVSRRMVRESADLVLLLLLLSSRGGDIPPLLRRTTMVAMFPRRTRRNRIPSPGRRRMGCSIHMYRDLAGGSSLSRSSRLGGLGPRLARR